MDLVDQTIALVVNKTLNAEVRNMDKNAVTHASLNARFRLAPMVMLAAAATLLVGLVGTASAAAPIGQDGAIHACYRVKGKPKGSLRVVPSAKKHCKRGERKVTWNVAGTGGQGGTSGQLGTGGQAGSAGQGGQTGTTGASGNEAVLQSKIASLNLKLEGLEGILNGISHGDLQGVLGTLNGVNNAKLLGAVDAVEGLTNGDLTGAVDALTGLNNTKLTDAVDAVTGLNNAKLLGAVNAVQGLDNTKLTDAVDAVTGLNNTKLTEAVDSLPAIDSLCTQASTLTGGINSLGLGVKGISVLGLPGLSLNTSALPTALEPFTCPS
jgi:hypothetical protein